MNFSLRFALKLTFSALALAVIAGCGPRDGLKELAEGKAALEEHNLAKATKAFEKSLALRPDNVDALVYYARTQLEIGELAVAEQAMTKAAALAPNDLDVRLLSAQLAWHTRDYRRARALYQAIAEDSKLSAQERARGWTGLGIVEMTENNYQLAHVAYLRALRLDRRNPAAWYHLALLYRDGLGYIEMALEKFDIFVRLEEMASPRVQKVQRQLIPALREQLSAAAANRPRASERNSAASSAAISKAEAAWAKGQFKSALKSYQEALAADALSYPAALGLAKAYLKTDATKAGSVRALENYKLACSLKPDAISTFLTTGALALKLGCYSMAVEVYSRAVAAAPTSLPAIDGLIQALKKVGGKSAIVQAYEGYRASLKVAKAKK